MKVLVIEDNRWMREQLELLLRRDSYVVDLAKNAEDGIAKAQIHDYDAIILDIGLPDRQDFETLVELRATYRGPVLIVTGRKALSARVRGLDGGADDYLTKPFEGEELLARLRAILRRRREATLTRIQIQTVAIDLGARRVFRDDKEVHLTHRQFAILRLLVLRRGQVVPLTVLLESLLDEHRDATTNLIHVYISHLRKKLGRELIATVHGQGYLIR